MVYHDHLATSVALRHLEELIPAWGQQYEAEVLSASQDKETSANLVKLGGMKVVGVFSCAIM